MSRSGRSRVCAKCATAPVAAGCSARTAATCNPPVVGTTADHWGVGLLIATPWARNPKVISAYVQDRAGTTWARDGHRAGTSPETTRASSRKPLSYLVAGEGFEPSTFGL
jgi:hypothetical protein